MSVRRRKIRERRQREELYAKRDAEQSAALRRVLDLCERKKISGEPITQKEVGDAIRGLVTS